MDIVNAMLIPAWIAKRLHRKLVSITKIFTILDEILCQNSFNMEAMYTTVEESLQLSLRASGLANQQNNNDSIKSSLFTIPIS